MITFFHTADVHFGVENYGKIDPKTGIHSRLLDFRDAFAQAVDQAVAEKIDFFLLCGDAYKTAYPTPTQQKLLMQLLLKLHEAQIPVVIIVGNHDHPLSFGKIHALDVFDYVPLDQFYVFSKPDALTIPTKNGPVQIVGVPWPTRNVLVAHEAHRFKNNQEIAQYLAEKVGAIIQGLAAQLDPQLPSILAGHLTVSSGIFSGSEKCAIFGTDPIFLTSQLAIEPFDYVALGHLHRHQNLNPQGYPPVVYSGSIERVDFGERKEEKGFCRVTLSNEHNKKKCSFDFIKINARPMIQLEVHLESGSNQTEQIVAYVARQNLKDALVKIIYYLPDGVSDKVDLLAVQRACSQAHYLVGIIPVHSLASRDRRAHLRIDMDFKTLLTTYLTSKKECVDEKDILMEKALKLYQALETEKEGDSEQCS